MAKVAVKAPATVPATTTEVEVPTVQLSAKAARRVLTHIINFILLTLDFEKFFSVTFTPETLANLKEEAADRAKRILGKFDAHTTEAEILAAVQLEYPISGKAALRSAGASSRKDDIAEVRALMTPELVEQWIALDGTLDEAGEKITLHPSAVDFAKERLEKMKMKAAKIAEKAVTEALAAMKTIEAVEEWIAANQGHAQLPEADIRLAQLKLHFKKTATLAPTAPSVADRKPIVATPAAPVATKTPVAVAASKK